jgi:hypothetical protein
MRLFLRSSQLDRAVEQKYVHERGKEDARVFCDDEQAQHGHDGKAPAAEARLLRAQTAQRSKCQRGQQKIHEKVIDPDADVENRQHRAPEAEQRGEQKALLVTNDAEHRVEARREQQSLSKQHDAFAVAHHAAEVVEKR